jgi:hypothetical protein
MWITSLMLRVDLRRREYGYILFVAGKFESV